MFHSASRFSSQPTPSQPTVSEQLDMLQQLGYAVVPTRPGEAKKLAYRDTPTRRYDLTHFANGEGIAVRTGLLDEGAYLVRIDIDQHRPGQNAEAVYQAIAAALGDTLSKCAVKRSTNGKGYDIVFKTTSPFPNNQRFLHAGRYAGELFCDGGRVNLPSNGEWLCGSLATLDVLTALEIDQLCSVISFTSTTQRVSWSERAREGQKLIRGWKQVTFENLLEPNGMPKLFSGSERKHHIAQANWRALQAATKGERSEAIASVVQSLMVLAPKSYGDSVEQRCRTIAAIAIAVNPRVDDKGNNVEKDTAALIARMLHGDPYEHGNGYFRSPYWADEYQPEPKSAAKGRPKRDKQQQLRKLRQILNRHADGGEVRHIGRHKLTVGLLATKLKVKERSVQSYLKTLEHNGEIVREQVGGRGGGLIITLMPMFGTER